MVDELFTINNRKRVSSNPQAGVRGRGAIRYSGVAATTRSTDAGVGSSRPSGRRQLSGKVKSLEQSSRLLPTSGKALRLEYSGTRDAPLPKSPVSGANKRQRLESLDFEDSGGLGAKTRPQSSFATTAAAASLRTAQTLQAISKAAASDCDDTVLEVMSGNTSDSDFADGDRESLSKQHRATPLESAQTRSRCDEDLKDSKSGDIPRPVLLSRPISLSDRLTIAKGESEQIVASGRVQRSMAGFSSKTSSTAPPEAKDFFSTPTLVKEGDTQTNKTPEKLVNQLRPKTSHTANDEEGQSNSASAGSKWSLDSLNNPLTVLPGRTSAGRSRDPLTRMYQQGFGSSPASPMSHRRRTIAIGPTIDLRSPSPPLMPAKSPPLKPQGRRLSKSSPQKQKQQQPQQRPAKSFPLRGVRIGHHVQIADVHAAHTTKDPSSHLKLTIRYLQRTMEISGLRESNELMKISVADILALEYNEQRNLAVMRIIPNETMESLFEEDVFDPACDDKSRCLIYLCWGTHAKGDKIAFAQLQESFGGDIDFGALDMSVFQKYASELTKPTSIDLISSDDDGDCGGDGSSGGSGGIAKLTADAAKSDTNRSHSQGSGHDKSASIGTNRELGVVKSQYWSSINSIASTSFMSSVGERTRGRSKGVDDDAHWERTNVYSKRALPSRAERRTSTPSFFATESRGYDLRKTSVGSMAEPPSSLEEDNNSGSDDDDFVVQHQKVGVNVYSLKFEYPPDGGKSIYVGGSDISRLRSGEFLNDTIIEFYMRYISENLRTADAKLYERCFFFNTFFFKKLSQRSRAITTDDDEDPMGVVYSQLKKWTASVDLFDKDFIFVPINENIHWYLAIITNPRVMLSANFEASDSDPSGNDANAGAATPPKPADSPDTSPTVGLPPLPSTLFSSSPPSSGPSLADDDSLAPALKDGDVDVDIEMGDSSANGSMASASAVAPQARVAEPQLELSPSTLELEGALKQDMGLDRSESASLGSDKSLPQHVIDLSLDAIPAPETADADVLKAKPKCVDPETTSSIIILDSLGNRHQPTFGLLRGYMQAEANYRHHRADVAEAMVGKYAKVPLQTNLCDCGVFLLQYIENFLKDPAVFMLNALNGADMRTWFDSGMMRKKRESMMRLAIRLANEYEQLQKNKTDTQDSAKSEAQPAAKEASEEADQPSDSLPAPADATASESSGKEPSVADDTE
ncbi:hypothetical protein IWW37_002301 [Coemansia sp. RSA 2050]|nr:hypothetical protein IWW37_002301 [Coemansia sp. RSA 2050]KAJ2734505.1 hypothetical protein IW152_002283 [Coemansia sp. BCRC 34962]